MWSRTLFLLLFETFLHGANLSDLDSLTSGAKEALFENNEHDIELLDNATDIGPNLKRKAPINYDWTGN